MTRTLKAVPVTLHAGMSRDDLGSVRQDYKYDRPWEDGRGKAERVGAVVGLILTGCLRRTCCGPILVTKRVLQRSYYSRRVPLLQP